MLGSGRGAQDLHRQRALLMARERVEQGWHLIRAAGPCEDDVDAREHRAVDRGWDRQPDLAQHVDADQSVVMVLGARHLREGRRDRELLKLREAGALPVAVRIDDPLAQVHVRLAVPAAAGLKYLATSRSAIARSGNCSIPQRAAAAGRGSGRALP
jgi:hypothetical protein